MQLRHVGVAVFGLWMLLPTAAFAHPFVLGDVPVQSAATLSVDMAHGCAAPDAAHAAGDGEVTREVAVRFDPAVSVRTVVDADGMTVVSAIRTDTYDEWTFVAPEGLAVPAPVITFSVVVDAAPTDTLWLQVFQGCDTIEHRWVATPDAPSGEPGVRVSLTAADPAAPSNGAPPRTVPPGASVDSQDGQTDDSDEADPLNDFLEIDLPQTTEAWLWYVVIAGVAGVLLAKRARNRGR